MKTAAVVVAFVSFLSAPWLAHAQVLASLQEQADPTQGATLDIQQDRERSQGSGLTLHGVGYLSYFAPFGEANSVNLVMGQLETQWTNGTFGVYNTLRARVTDIQDPIRYGYISFQQAYGFWRHAFGDVKVGKVYSRFGRTWDYGFYGPLVANNDMKLQPNLGISAEGAPSITSALDLEYALQYFAVDGKTFALNNRQPFSLDGMRRRNLVVARVAPTYHMGHDSWLGVGVSGERFDSMRTDGHQVVRGAVDVDAAYGPLLAFVEVGRQGAADVVASKNERVLAHDYVWTGAELKMDGVNVRYHFNALRYDDGARSVEYLHQPGIEVAVNEHMALMGELVLWTSPNSTKPEREKSFYLVVTGKT